MAVSAAGLLPSAKRMTKNVDGMS